MTASSFFRTIMIVIWVMVCLVSAIVLFMFLGAASERAASVPVPNSIFDHGPIALAEVLGFFLIAPLATIWLGLRLILRRHELKHLPMWGLGGIVLASGFLISLLFHGAVETTKYRVLGLLGLIGLGHWLATRSTRPKAVA